MENLANGITTLINGLGRLIDAAAGPVPVAFAISALCLLWLCRVELDELDRQGAKPSVGRH